MKIVLFGFIIALLFVVNENIYSQPDSVKGGYRKCEYYWKANSKDKLGNQPPQLLFVYLFNDVGKKTESACYEKNGDLSSKTGFKYNVKGNLIEEVEYNADNSIKYVRIHDYNEDGKECAIKQSCTDGSIFLETTFKYDDKKNMIEEVDYNADNSIANKTTRKYNDKGKEIEYVRYINGKSMEEKLDLLYDDRGNIIEVIFYVADGSIYSKGKSIFDENNKKIEELRYNTDGSLYSRSIKKYDDNGNKIEEITYNSKGGISFHNTYKYDDDGNMIENITYDALHKPMYEYYFIYSK